MSHTRTSQTLLDQSRKTQISQPFRWPKPGQRIYENRAAKLNPRISTLTPKQRLGSSHGKNISPKDSLKSLHKLLGI